ncbi:T-cell surface glycoprotein CD3 zeta chain [Liparis tanakae]|uniref:T-cell surface glycoprotein CD3 zeta chain n=1 Tax=Liparis tanakae TaxID=230148 RepID=A0A4Z2FH42_9TELE|nr:T-cell surface glycoprotein CD3 zeta chain [Liparis tanakae]
MYRYLCTSEAVALYSPQLCYVLDGFLCAYGLVITAMFLREKVCALIVKGLPALIVALHLLIFQMFQFFRTKMKRTEEVLYSDLEDQSSGTYNQLTRPRRQRKNEQLYQGLSSATRDTYDALQMQPLPPLHPR